MTKKGCRRILWVPMPSGHAGKSYADAHSVAEISSPQKGCILLRDEIPRGERYDWRKRAADEVSDALLSARYWRAAERVRECAYVVCFWGGRVTAPYCRYRHCPICQWRRSLRARAIVLTRLPEILDQYPTARFAMLTLTVRNCALCDLRSTLRQMSRGWQRLIQRADWPAIGWIRAVEITRSSDGSAHPHYHVLMMLPSSYFGKGYVPTREWVARWRHAMRLDYDPVCDVRAIKPRPVAGAEYRDVRLAAVCAAIAELIKYATKSDDLLAGGPEWLSEYIRQVRSTKGLVSGGVLRGIMAEAHRSADDTTVESDDGCVCGVRYQWRRSLQAYARSEK